MTYRFPFPLVSIRQRFGIRITSVLAPPTDITSDRPSLASRLEYADIVSIPIVFARLALGSLITLCLISVAALCFLTG